MKRLLAFLELEMIAMLFEACSMFHKPNMRNNLFSHGFVVFCHVIY